MLTNLTKPTSFFSNWNIQCNQIPSKYLKSLFLSLGSILTLRLTKSPSVQSPFEFLFHRMKYVQERVTRMVPVILLKSVRLVMAQLQEVVLRVMEFAVQVSELETLGFSIFTGIFG